MKSALSASVPKVSGVYSGTLTVKESGHTATGAVTMTIKQSLSKVSGPFDVTFGTKTTKLTFSGTVKGDTQGADLKFTIYKTKTQYAHASAEIIGGVLTGKAYVPPSGSNPAVYITFTMTKAAL